MAKSKPPKLCVMFDTNILYTQVASDLVRSSVQALINENSNHNDLNIEWFIPEVVIGERRHQMLKKAIDLIPSMKRLENLIGHNFGIGEDTLEMHVNRSISSSLDSFDLKVKDCKVSDVNWEEVINRSVSRKPPFEDNEKEKGFRDAIIGNTFYQLWKSQPSTPSICRLAIVSEDIKLQEYVKEITQQAKNIRVLSSLDELESLINTLVSEISEDFAEELTERASKIFFEKENEKTFYYKQKISERIREQYGNELKNSPIEGLSKDISEKTWWIREPVFIKKSKSRIHWTTSIEPEFELYHTEESEEGAANTPALRTESTKNLLAIASLLGKRKKIVDQKGRDIFEIHWSTTLSAAKNLTQPKLDKISYTGNNLEEK